MWARFARVIWRFLILVPVLFAAGAGWRMWLAARDRCPALWHCATGAVPVHDLAAIAQVSVPAAYLLALVASVIHLPRRVMVVAVDGTAGSGKGALAQRLAERLGFAHLDSGALYRVIALTVLESGGNPAKKRDVLDAARRLDIARRHDRAIRGDAVGRAAVQVSRFRAVRKLVHRVQADFIANPPDGAPGTVVDGRDIGTVVAPNAVVKLFVDARPQVRAHRRWAALRNRRVLQDEAEILKEILARDRADRTRRVSPLRRARDAFLLDTSDLAIDAAFAVALALVKAGVENALSPPAKG